MKLRFLLYLLFNVFLLSAQDSAQIQELKRKRSATAAEIEKTNQLLKENTLTTSNALNHLNLLGQQIESRKKNINLLNQVVDSLAVEIQGKETNLKTLEKSLAEKKQHYATAVRKIYFHKTNQDNLLFILSSRSFSETIHRMLYLKAYSQWQKRQADEIVERQKIVNQEKEVLVARRGDKLHLISVRQTEEKQLSKEETNKKAEITKLEKNRKKLQADLSEKEKQAKALNKQIEKIIAEEVLRSKKAAAAAAAARKSKKESNRTAAVKGGYVMTDSERTLSANFAENQGNLPFPLKGNYRIVGYFGVHRHKDLSRVTTNNNGIDIETTSGNEARAVFDGKIASIFTLPGYENSIIVRHGNYLTLYSNLEQVYVKQGDNVKTGQALGKIFTDKEKGNSTLLHFEIWKEMNKLDPMSWIK